MTKYAMLKTVAAAALVVGAAACSSAQDAAGQAGGAAQDATGQAGAAGQDAAGAAGQKIQALVQAHPVTFDSRSAELSSEDTQTLQQVAAVQKTTGTTLTVATHAGYPDADQAQQLSQQRADNIAKAMQEAGVDASKLKTEPTGNSTAQGDQALRTEISAS